MKIFTKGEQMKLALTFASALLAFSAFADTAQETAGAYESVKIKVEICRTTYSLGVLKANSGKMTAEDAYREYLLCKSEAAKGAKSAYAKLMPKIKSASGKGALKDFQAALMTSIEAGEPKGDELKVQYERRLATLDEKVESAWQRLQLEL